MILEEVGNLLESNGIGTQGTDIFLGNMPDSLTADPIVVVYEYLGMPIHWSQTGKLDKTRLQFQTRSSDYSTGRQKITDVFNVVNSVSNTPLDGVMYYRIQPIQAPSFLSRDEDNRPIFIFNAQVTKEFS